MNHFSVVTCLVLFGLFLTTSPAEGFVRGYRYIGLPDQRLRAPSWRLGGLTKQEIMDAEISAEENREHSKEFLVRTPDNEDVHSRSLSKKYDENADGETLVGTTDPYSIIFPTGPEPPEKYENVNAHNANQIPDTTTGKRADGVAAKVKYGQANNKYDNNENDLNAQNAASISVILQFPSKY